MKEGTKSVLIGVHGIWHSIFVFMAWKKHHGRYPRFWEAVCILVHDWGYWGLDYITQGSNAGHAELGARIAQLLFGEKGRLLVLGHSSSSVKKHKVPVSALEAPDDYSWLIMPMWLLRINCAIEGFPGTPEAWVRVVRENWTRKERVPAYELMQTYHQH